MITKQASLRQHLLFAIAGLFALLCFDISGLDRPIAEWMLRITGGTTAIGQANYGFPLRGVAWFELLFHKGLKNSLWLWVLLILINTLNLKQTWAQKLRFNVPAPAWRVMLGLILLIPLFVSLLKSQSLPYCPWDVTGLGGTQPQYEWFDRLLGLLQSETKNGRCWPAGHASGGFALLASYAVFRVVKPLWAKPALYAALAFGIVMGLAQQFKGAHFMSHTLWTAWFAWVIAIFGTHFCKRWLKL